MNYFTILAQAAQVEDSSASVTSDQIVPIDALWSQITSLGFLEALTFISFGAVCLFYGWRVFRLLVVICFALLGMAVGVIAAGKISGENNQILGGVVGLILLAALSFPLMKWAVSILGAVAGGILTSGLWYAFELPEQYIWAGGLIGVVAGGMIAFIALKYAIMLFSCLGGSTLIVVGFLALLYLYPDTTEQVEELVFNENWFLPVALLIPTAIGFILQQKFIKKSSEWSV